MKKILTAAFVVLLLTQEGHSISEPELQQQFGHLFPSAHTMTHENFSRLAAYVLTQAKCPVTDKEVTSLKRYVDRLPARNRGAHKDLIDLSLTLHQVLGGGSGLGYFQLIQGESIQNKDTLIDAARTLVPTGESPFYKEFMLGCILKVQDEKRKEFAESVTQILYEEEGVRAQNPIRRETDIRRILVFLMSHSAPDAWNLVKKARGLYENLDSFGEALTSLFERHRFDCKNLGRVTVEAIDWAHLARLDPDAPDFPQTRTYSKEDLYPFSDDYDDSDTESSVSDAEPKADSDQENSEANLPSDADNSDGAWETEDEDDQDDDKDDDAGAGKYQVESAGASEDEEEEEEDDNADHRPRAVGYVRHSHDPSGSTLGKIEEMMERLNQMRSRIGMGEPEREDEQDDDRDDQSSPNESDADDHKSTTDDEDSDEDYRRVFTQPELQSMIDELGQILPQNSEEYSTLRSHLIHNPRAIRPSATHLWIKRLGSIDAFVKLVKGLETLFPPLSFNQWVGFLVRFDDEYDFPSPDEDFKFLEVEKILGSLKMIGQLFEKDEQHVDHFMKCFKRLMSTPSDRMDAINQVVLHLYRHRGPKLYSLPFHLLDVAKHYINCLDQALPLLKSFQQLKISGLAYQSYLGSLDSCLCDQNYTDVEKIKILAHMVEQVDKREKMGKTHLEIVWEDLSMIIEEALGDARDFRYLQHQEEDLGDEAWSRQPDIHEATGSLTIRMGNGRKDSVLQIIRTYLKEDLGIKPISTRKTTREIKAFIDTHLGKESEKEGIKTLKVYKDMIRMAGNEASDKGLFRYVWPYMKSLPTATTAAWLDNALSESLTANNDDADRAEDASCPPGILERLSITGFLEGTDPVLQGLSHATRLMGGFVSEGLTLVYLKKAIAALPAEQKGLLIQSPSSLPDDLKKQFQTWMRDGFKRLLEDDDILGLAKSKAPQLPEDIIKSLGKHLDDAISVFATDYYADAVEPLHAPVARRKSHEPDETE